jgi:hypothetical protein
MNSCKWPGRHRGVPAGASEVREHSAELDLVERVVLAGRAWSDMDSVADHTAGVAYTAVTPRPKAARAKLSTGRATGLGG